MSVSEDESSVKVAVRIRPQIAREVIDGCRICTNVTPGEPQVTLGSDKSFTYDYVFDTHENQQTVYEDCASSLVAGALQGYNATVLAYGQTGSGKTYTMGSGFDLENVDDSDPSATGIIPRAIHQLFDGIQNIKQQSMDNGEPPPHFTVTAQFLELYNEEIIDLFDTACDYSSAKSKNGIRIHEDMQHNIYVTGVSWKTINSASEALSSLRQGALSRTTAATAMNSQSSRSHAVFTINIQQKRFVKQEDEGTESTLEECGTNSTGNRNAGEFETLTAKFHFVDLAGSERLKRTGATGDRAKEGISINCGLLALGNVISALGDRSRKVMHVPYRDSKLTRLLQDSLGGNSRTVMIACVSPSDRDFMETLNTLKYANRARNIQNKVVINQDKSSRTIQILRQEIQQLQLEIMEYKQGKRTVNENGEECVNDTYLENNMLQTEISNMRTRIKAMQETIDVLTTKNTQLLAEKATGAWLNTDAGLESNMADVIQGYLKEIEELRAKLLESEHMCGQLRKNASSPVKSHFTNSNNDEYSSKELIAKAKLELENEKQTLQRLISVKSHGSDSESTDSADSEDNSSDDEDERASVDSQYSQELANLTSEINLKQKLIEELELSQRRLANLRQHYEEKLQQLQTKIKLTQDERDTVLTSLGSSNTNNQSEKVKRVKDDYERKLTTMQKELKSLQSARKEHAKLLRDQSQYENQIRTLRYEVNDMKRTKVKLMNKIKEETTRHHESEMKKAKEIAQLRKESRRAEIRMRNLESKSRMRDVVLKRKQEEVTALRRAARAMNNRGSATGAKAIQKNSKQTWINLEKNISALTLNKQTLYSLEKDMERLLQERMKLHSDLDFKLKKLADAQVQQPRDSNLHRDFEDEIEAIRANLDYVDESIKELQENILQIEDSKTATESLELNNRVTNMTDAVYVMEKLYQMSLHNSCLAAQRDISVKELETKMQQLEKENEIQRQLIEHMLSSRDRMIDLPTSMTTSSDRDVRSVMSSTSSSRSASPTEMTTSTRSDTGTSKHRRRPAQAQELLYASKNIEPQQPQRIPLVRVPSASSFLRPDKYRPSPVMGRKQVERQESVSPRMIRRGTFIIAPNTNLLGKPGSMDRLNKSPPNSPPAYRRTVSRDENVFSRLTSSTTQFDQHRSKGVIQPFHGKTSMKSPLICTHITEGHSRAVLAVCATEDLLFSASKDKTVKIWDLNNGKEIQTLSGHPNSVVAIKYDEYTQLVLSVTSSYVRVWDMRQSRCIKTLSSSGIVNNGSVMSSQIPVGEILLNDIALNNHGRTLYMASGDKVKIWDMRKFAIRGKLSGGHTAAVMCLAIGRLGSKDIVVTGSKDHYIKMFEVGEEAVGTYNPTVNLEPPHYDGIQSLAIRHNILFSGSRDYAIKKWDLDKQDLVTSINNAHKDWICGLAMVPDQPLLLSVCRSGSLKMWSESTCALLGETKAHDSQINAIATNSTHVFTAAHDGAVKLWRVKCRLDTMA
ncbi:kinesin-like protein KIF21A isoform X2 [Adelges cooleyi]|uniref:kinesin-like protein KIF21A isoform X2 n=1 Tax=Adelges cooleyi TaxID=133065 RepID=UPI002180243A|nr:kinesin-like protein KIF21A isoform X2 [Adelges cooleyi]